MLQYEHITGLISELLYKHDCVIVPEFGGFVARHHSAGFGKGNTILHPPAKHVLFNKNLVHNDGLLVSALVEKSGNSYQESLKLLGDYKDYIQSLLSVKRRYELAQVGLLYLDTENTLRFEAKSDVNFLIDSFGFEPVIASELVVEEITKPVVKQFEDRTISIAQPIVPVKQKRSYAKVAALAITVPVSLALILFAAASKPVQPFLQSSLNPFYSAEKTYTPNNSASSKACFIQKLSQQPLLEDANGFATYTLNNNDRVLIATNHINESQADKTSVKKAAYPALRHSFDGKFQVVVGCFGVEKNAEKLISELASKHIEAGISGVNPKGLHVVSCGGFNAKEDAVALLNNIKASYPNAWVMAK